MAAVDEAPAKTRINPAAIGLLLGGVMVAAGSFLPWMTASTALGGASRSGIDEGVGWVSLLLGCLMVIAGLANLRANSSRIWMWILGLPLFTLGAAAGEYSNLQGLISEVDPDVFGIGMGLWLILVGAGIAAVSSFGLRPRPPA